MSTTPAAHPSARPPRSASGGSAAQINGNENRNGSGNGTTTSTANNTPTPTPGKMTAYIPSARQSARSAALSEAAAVLQSPGLTRGTDERDYLNSFNLLSVVSNPRAGAGLWGDVHAATASSGHGAAAGSSHGAAGDAANPTAPSIGDGTPATNPNAVATSALSAATGLSLSALAPLTDVEETIAEGLHDLSTTINTVNTYFSTISSYSLGNSILPPLPGTSDDDPFGLGGEYMEYEGLEELGEGHMTAQLLPEELREELRGVDLATVEAYLRRCGGLAWRFDSRRGESELINVGDGPGGGSATAVVGGGGNSAKNLAGEMDMERAVEDGDDDEEEEKKDQKEDGKGKYDQGSAAAVGDDDGDDDPTNDVPDIFFSPYFDLTDPHTFESLLVMDEEEDNIGGNTAGTAVPAATTAATNGNDETDPNLMTIHPTESLSSHLDAIELALLNQVRSKSSSFFRETNRFSYLQHQVAECVAEVRSLRASLGNVKERTVTDVELIPIMDRKRQELRLLGAVLDEGSVAGLIAAGDYVGAVAAIRNARSLLRGDKKKNNNNNKDKEDNAKESGEDEKTMEEDDDGDDTNMTPTERAEKEAAEAALNFPLSRLAAMSKVDDQLNQYEELVVNDLANELVETFLSWENGSSSSSNTASLLSSPFSLSGGVGRRSRTREIVHALSLCQKLGYAADLYKTKLSDVVRVTVRTTVTECAADALAELERTKNSKKI